MSATKKTQTRSGLTPYTDLGRVFYSAEEWKRKKILKELEAAGISYYSFRGYLVATKPFRASGDLKAIVLATLPEAADCFNDPRVLTPKQQPA